MSHDIAKLRQAISTNDILAIQYLIFDKNPVKVRTPFRREGLYWDFKGNCPSSRKGNDAAWARIAKHVLAFHNKQGGVLIFGVQDKTHKITFTNAEMEDGEFNKKIYKYIDDSIYVNYFPCFRQSDGTYIGIAIIPPRGHSILQFKHDFKLDNGEYLFKKGDVAIRNRDESRVYTDQKAKSLLKRYSVGNDGTYILDTQYFRLFLPDYSSFIERSDPCKKILEGLHDPRTSVVAITGFGGVGKTALATWAVERVYEEQHFSFIVSMTAKDRSLGPMGIVENKQYLDNFETLLDAILDVLNDHSCKHLDTDKKESYVKQSIESLNGLIFVDNLETIEDFRIINFLDSLPIGVKAITTSRRKMVNRFVFPVAISGFTEEESIKYIEALSSEDGYSYLDTLSESEAKTFCYYCDYIPLAMKWVASRAETKTQLLTIANEIKTTGRSGKEFIEFSFRRIFDSFSKIERTITVALALHSTPLDNYALEFISRADPYETEEALEKLHNDGLIKRYTQGTHGYKYSPVPITRVFILSCCASKNDTDEICKLLNTYFSAEDIPDAEDRDIIKKSRLNGHSAESLIILANKAIYSRDYEKAEEQLKDIIAKYPNDPKPYRILAELYKRYLDKKPLAIYYYERCLALLTHQHEDFFIVHREYGLILMHSGQSDYESKALHSFEKAFQTDPRDGITLRFLAILYGKTNQHHKIPHLEPHVRAIDNQKTNQHFYPELFKAHITLGNHLEADELRKKFPRYIATT